MKKRLLLIPIVLNSFLLGCSSKQIFNEALEIEKRSLEQDYVSVTIHQTATAKKDGTSKSSKAQNEIIRFDSDEGPCLIHVEDLKTSYYFPERAFSFQNSHPEDVHYFETLEVTDYRDVLKGNTLFDDIEQYINADNITAKKKKDGAYTYYDFTFKHFDDLFHKITNQEYISLQEEGDLVLPSSLQVRDGVKDGLILFEESTINFTANQANICYTLRLDFTYDGNKIIPDNIKNAIREDEFDEKLSNLEISHIKEISFDHKGQMPSYNESLMAEDTSGRGQYFQLSNSSKGSLYGDGKKYIVYFEDENIDERNHKLTVYDATTFKELYTVTFQRKIYPAIRLGDEKIIINLMFDNHHYSSPSCVYSLEDFSLIGTVGSKPLIVGDNIYYQNNQQGIYKFMVFNTKSGQRNTLYTFQKEDIPKDSVSFDYYFYHSKINNMVFMYYYRGGTTIRYVGYNCLNNEKVYEKETNEISSEYAGNSVQWLDYGFSYEKCPKMIEIKSGNLTDNTNPNPHQYILPETLKDYEIKANRYLNQKYDHIIIRHEEQKEGSWVKIIDEQYWIYDKENDLFVARVYFNQLDEFITNNNYYVCLLYNQGALIDLN